MGRRIAKYGVLLSLLTACLISVSWGQGTVPRFDATYQIDYFPNLLKYDGLKKVVNDGFYGDTNAANVCDMIYVFQNEQLSECCGCYVTPNGSRDFDVNTSFNRNDLRGKTYNELIVKQVGSGPVGASSDFDTHGAGQCNPTKPAPAFGLHGWAVKTQVVPGVTAPGITETPSQNADLGAAELADLGEDCTVLLELGSGSGVCTCGTFD